MSDSLRTAVDHLRTATGIDFKVSEEPVSGTNLHIVYVEAHALPTTYTAPQGLLGFRVPANIPDAGPEDAFFIAPGKLALQTADAVRNSTAINRAGLNNDYTKGALPDNPPVLVFSWHLWNTVPWDRRKNTLLDHYGHCLRRFDLPEHD